MRTRYTRGLINGTVLRHARELRADATDAEHRLWSRLRRDQLGVRFRRQYPVAGFIADFCSPTIKLVIEVDGGQHAERITRDQQRTRRIESCGYRVLRFWNNDVLTNIDGVMERIAEAIRSPSPARHGC